MSSESHFSRGKEKVKLNESSQSAKASPKSDKILARD